MTINLSKTTIKPFSIEEMQASIVDYYNDNKDYTDMATLELEDLHQAVFNTDYYVIGEYKARKCIEEVGVFDVLEYVQDWYDVNFGEPFKYENGEQLANIYSYIVSDEYIRNFDDVESLLEDCGIELTVE